MSALRELISSFQNHSFHSNVNCVIYWSRSKVGLACSCHNLRRKARYTCICTYNYDAKINVILGAGVARSVSCVTADWTTGVRSRQRQRIFPVAIVSRPALRPTQYPIQWVPWVKRGRIVTLTTHPHLLPRLRMSRS
jgi:hypothetical protein